MLKTYLLLFLCFISVSIIAQKAEPQVSFAREDKPVSYYVEQAELWSAELEKDSLSETNWFNYFRACRNVHGKSAWHSDFLKLSPKLMMGEDIVAQMQEYIPNTFMYYYLSYLTNGIGTDNNQNLLKAYEMNPHYPGIASSMVSYAESSIQPDLRKEVNEAWYEDNYISHQLMNYCYNALMSVEPYGMLFTQGDNDTYPTWMLQDALGIRTDVTVINIDFLLLDDFRNHFFKELDLPGMNLGEINSDEYHANWEKVVHHILNHYSGNRPLYLSMTLFNHLYEDFEDQLFTSGLTFKYSTKPLDLTNKNVVFYEDNFLLDYLLYNFSSDLNQTNVDYLNINYIQLFKEVYDYYKSENRNTDAIKIKNTSLILAERTDNPDYLKKVEEMFK